MNRLSKAEYIWQTAKRIGKKVILLNFPGGWSPNIKNGVVVDRTEPYSSPVCRMSNKMRFSSNSDKAFSYSSNNKLKIEKAKG